MNSSRIVYVPVRSVRGRSSQAGVVLFLALMALVILSLAAVALIRSVDTNTLIAGNLAFKQSAIASADSGVETAVSWLGAASALDADSTVNSYYATSPTDALTLANASAKAASGTGITAGGVDSSGNKITYVIQRMCKNTGAPSAAHCLYGPGLADRNSKLVCDASNPCLNDATGGSLIYRVTVRVGGPKNTVSYTQAFVY